MMLIWSLLGKRVPLKIVEIVDTVPVLDETPVGWGTWKSMERLED